MSSRSLPSGSNPRFNSAASVDAYQGTYKQMHPFVQQMVDQIIDPASVTIEERIPQYGVSATYKATNIFQCRYDTTGRSSMIVSPLLRNSIYLTAGDTFEQALYYPETGQAPFTRINISLEANSSVEVATPFFFNNGHVALASPSAQTSNLLYPIGLASADFPVTTTDYKLMGQCFPYLSDGLLSCTVQSYDANKDPVNSASFGNFDQNGHMEAAIWLPTDTAEARFCNIVISTNNAPFEGEVVLCLAVHKYSGSGPAPPAPPTISAHLSDRCNHMIHYDINGSDQILDGAQKFTVISQSALLTYLGSDLNNGGQLAIGRMPAGTVIGSNAGDETVDNWYSYIANLSKNTYNGPVKDGGYTFYLGEV